MVLCRTRTYRLSSRGLAPLGLLVQGKLVTLNAQIDLERVRLGQAPDPQ